MNGSGNHTPWSLPGCPGKYRKSWLNNEGGTRFHFIYILEIAGMLLLDKDDMVQKGYGWMLKVAGRVESFGDGQVVDKSRV